MPMDKSVIISKDAICPECKSALTSWRTDGGVMYRQCVMCRICLVPIDIGRADGDMLCRVIDTAELLYMIR